MTYEYKYFFAIGGSAVYCCRLSFDGPASPSGSPIGIRLLSCSGGSWI